jgi:hypothetical protein
MGVIGTYIVAGFGLLVLFLLGIHRRGGTRPR